MDSKPVVSQHDAGYSIRNAGAHWAITYSAMASPCEVLVRRGGDTAPLGAASDVIAGATGAGAAAPGGGVLESAPAAGAVGGGSSLEVAERHLEHLASLAYDETLRIEKKFSRYRNDNILHAINHSDGARVPVDDETSRLLLYAGQCYGLSGGRFDVTSGVLRCAWTFNGGTVTPDKKLIESLRERVGWSRVEFDGASIRLPRGMEIDLGGIGKEYAADRVAALVAEAAGTAVLVNLGGDIRAIASPEDRRRWTIGIEQPGRSEGTGGQKAAVGQIEIAEGGVATSGDSHRFCIVDGARLGHILDPRTGWPVDGAPRSVSVVADTCTAAGFLATVAILHGPDAKRFLEAQSVTYHCVR
jgi:FAD:protein FMN transferase